MIRKNSFIFSDRRPLARHAARYQKQITRKSMAHGEIKTVKAVMRHATSPSVLSVPLWADSFMELGKTRFSKARTTKKYCLYTGRVRSVNEFNLSKYAVKILTRAGTLKGLKKD